MAKPRAMKGIDPSRTRYASVNHTEASSLTPPATYAKGKSTARVSAAKKMAVRHFDSRYTRGGSGVARMRRSIFIPLSLATEMPKLKIITLATEYTAIEARK